MKLHLINVAIEIAARLLLWLAALIIVAMAIGTGYDVVMRYIFRQPTGAVLTLSSAALPTFTFLTIGGIMWSRRHIELDLLHRVLRPSAKLMADIISGLATMIFGITMSWLSYDAMISTYMSGFRTSGNFNIAIWPLYAFVSGGCIILAVISLAFPWRPWLVERRRAVDVDGKDNA